MRRSLPRVAWAAALLACLVFLMPSFGGARIGTALAAGNITATHYNLSATVNQPFSGTVALFLDANLSDTTASFQLLHIDWGDGSVLDTTTGSLTGSSGYFAVKGSHTYTAIGQFPLDVQISYQGATIDLTGIAFVNACAPPSTAPSSLAQAVLASGPLGFWRLDDSAASGCIADSSGHNLTGTPSAAGLAHGQSGPPGDPTAALGFDGQSGYVSLGDPASLQPGQISVEAWIKTPTTGVTQIIVRKRLDGYMLWVGGSGKPFFGINDSSGTPYNVSGASSVADGNWHFLVGTYDGSNVCLYVDGTKAACAQAGTIAYQPDAVAIGRDGGASDGYFNGSIADVAIYGRALYPAEITGQNTAGSTPSAVTCTPSATPSAYSSAVLASAPLGYWRLNETCRGIVSDASGHGLSGMAFSGVTPNQPGPLPGGADASMSFDTPYSPYIELGDPMMLQPANVSVEAWVNTDVLQPYQSIIVRKRGYGYALFENAYGNSGCGCTAGFSINDRNGTSYTANGTTSILDGHWHYLVGTYDGSHVCIYVDGVQQNCVPAGTIYYQPDLVAIGQDGSYIPPEQYYTPQFIGRISEVAIYGHALSASEVQAHYAAAQTTSVTIQIAQGWNLISLPLQPTTPLDARTLLGGILHDSTATLAALYALHGSGWTLLGIAHQGAVTGQNGTLTPGTGYLLYTDQPATYTVTGTVPTPLPRWQIGAGWNLVSISQGSLAASQAVSDVLANSHGALATIYQLSAGRWSAPVIAQAHDPTRGPAFTLVPGAGYLLYSDQPVTVMPGGSGQTAAARLAISGDGLRAQQPATVPAPPSVP